MVLVHVSKGGTFSNNTVYFLSNADIWALTVLNSPVGWWFAWRKAQHGKDEALRYFTAFMEEFPIPKPTDEPRRAVEKGVGQLIEITKAQQAATHELLDWLRMEHEVAKPSLRLQAPADLSADEFVAEVQKARGKKKSLTAAALKSLRDEYDRLIVPMQTRATEALDLERDLSALVNAAYGLTPVEEKLLWQTAPPRMPIPGAPPVG